MKGDLDSLWPDRGVIQGHFGMYIDCKPNIGEHRNVLFHVKGDDKLPLLPETVATWRSYESHY